uniref:DDE Tnp4 domain-containing protein n=1 Tax=Amphimedon queenslandica TaxID=400682 RepID=A0A1X7V2G5_AMPQE
MGELAYPLLLWLLKPYHESPNATNKEKHYHYHQTRARKVLENAFGRFKGQWRCCLKGMDYHPTDVRVILATCVTLHNFCERFCDNYHEDWIDSGVGTSTAPPTQASSLIINLSSTIMNTVTQIT